MSYSSSLVFPVCFFGGFGIELKLKIRYLAKYCPSSNKKLLREKEYSVNIQGSKTKSMQKPLSASLMKLQQWKSHSSENEFWLHLC